MMFNTKRIKDLEFRLKASVDYSDKLNRVNEQYIKLADENDKTIRLLKEQLAALQGAFDEQHARLGELKQELSHTKGKLFDANKEKHKYKVWYEAICYDVKTKCNACEVCNHKSCADCVASSHFKWRGEPEI